jgi:glutaminyl-peptide cyclotransferase
VAQGSRLAGGRWMTARRVAVVFGFTGLLAFPHGACAGASNGSKAPPAAVETPPAVQAAPAAPAVPSTPLRFDGTKAWEHLRRQVAFGPRPAGTPALAKTRQYIVDQLKAAHITTKEQPFTAETPAGPVAMVNVIGTIPGRRPERIVLASHYDTKRAPQFTFVGANDGASSTAALLELGRVLAASQPTFTIELLFLDGEEAVNWTWAGTDNTYGSRHYVAAAQKSGALAGVKALVLLDMIGDRDLLIRRDSNSTPWLVDAVWSAAARIGHAGTFLNELTTIEDDHVPFVKAGVPAVDLIDLDNATWHTAQDDLEHVSQKSLQIVGDVVLAALPAIEQRLTTAR